MFNAEQKNYLKQYWGVFEEAVLKIGGDRRQPHPGTQRFLLWLLPSGPGQVNKILMREDQRGHHRRKASLAKNALIAMRH